MHLPCVRLIHGADLHREILYGRRENKRHGKRGKERERISEQRTTSPFYVYGYFSTTDEILLPTCGLEIKRSPKEAGTAKERHTKRSTAFPDPAQQKTSRLFDRNHSAMRLFIFTVSRESRRSDTALLRRFL